MKRYLVLMILCLLAAVAWGQTSYLPLDQGWSWTLGDDVGRILHVTVEGHEIVHGKATVTLRWEETDPPGQVYRNFWTHDRDGGAVLHGAWNEDGFIASYKPGLAWVPPVDLGLRCWDMFSDMFESLDNAEPAGEIRRERCVDDQQILDVPAGVFTSVRIGYAEAPPRDGAYDLLGRRLPVGAARDDGGHWYSEGVGLIKYDGFELLSYSDPTANASATWGEVKSLYR